jgi:hypothetical protein
MSSVYLQSLKKTEMCVYVFDDETKDARLERTLVSYEFSHGNVTFFICFV